MAGVVVDSLEFCFQAVVAGTPLQGAQLDVHYVPLRLHCSKCNATTEIDMPQFFCDSCGASTVTIVSGTELQVMEIEMRDEGER
jgi:hydrogenase nickel incorporation protein HypA/HybF